MNFGVFESRTLSAYGRNLIITCKQNGFHVHRNRTKKSGMYEHKII